MRAIRPHTFYVSTMSLPALAAAVLWGLIEWLALGRARLAALWHRVRG